MVFWVSFLVFLAGMLTYMLFPRNDLYQLHMTQEEGNIVTFVNQHQAAKDYMYQMITWNPDSADANHIYVFPYKGLDKMLPWGMTTDVYNIGETTQVNPDTITGSRGSYSSALVCIANETGDDKYENEKKLVKCPGTDQYVITYGYMPDWWTDRSHPDSLDRMAWFKAMLKRTRGSANCGLLAYRNATDAKDRPLYSIDNSQRYKGFTTLSGKEVVYPALTQALVSAGLNTCATTGCTDKLNDLFFCMTPVSNPYHGTPNFHWDVLNNTGTGPESDSNAVGEPLIGAFSFGSSINLTLSDTYTVAGVVSPYSGSVASTDLLGNLIQSNCNTTCTITAGGTTISDVPATKGFSFIYSVNNTPKQTLKVYYTDSTGTLTEKTDTKNTAPATSETPALGLSGGHKIRDIRIYTGGIAEDDLEHNVLVDKKRFGL